MNSYGAALITSLQDTTVSSAQGDFRNTHDYGGKKDVNGNVPRNNLPSPKDINDALAIFNRLYKLTRYSIRLYFFMS